MLKFQLCYLNTMSCKIQHDSVWCSARKTFFCFAYHSIQHTLSGRFPGIQRHASLLQQLLAHHLNLGLCLDAFLQAVEALLWRQLEGVDLSCRHVQDVDHLQEKTQHDQGFLRNLIFLFRQTWTSSLASIINNHHHNSSWPGALCEQDTFRISHTMWRT